MINKPKCDAIIHHRRSIRLPHYDYAQPRGYFIALCTQNRAYLFGDIIKGKMVLNDTGIMVEKCWNEIPQHFTNVILDEHAIMPNHFHGIIMIDCDIVGANVGANNCPYANGKWARQKQLGPLSVDLKLG